MAMIFHKVKGALQRFDQASTTFISTTWWLLLWSLYLAAGVFLPYFYKPRSVWILPLLVVTMVITFMTEREERWRGIMLMNTLVSMVMVPGLLVFSIYRSVTGAFHPAHSFSETFLFLAVQFLALFLGGMHLAYTRKRWQTFPPRYLRPKIPLPHTPSLDDPLLTGTAFLLAVSYPVVLYCLSVFIKRLLASPPLFFFLAFSVLLTFLAADFFVIRWIRKILHTR